MGFKEIPQVRFPKSEESREGCLHPHKSSLARRDAVLPLNPVQASKLSEERKEFRRVELQLESFTRLKRRKRYRFGRGPLSRFYFSLINELPSHTSVGGGWVIDQSWQKY